MKIGRPMNFLRLQLCGLLSAALLIAGCAPPASNDPIADMSRALVSLQLSPENGSIAKGTQQQLIAKATFSDGSMQDVSQMVS